MQNKIVAQNLRRATKLEVFISKNWQGLSRSLARQLLIHKFVRLNDSFPKLNSKISDDDIVELEIEKIREYLLNNFANKFLPENLPLDIIFEDENILVINKKSGIVVHPDQHYKSGTLMNAVSFHIINSSDNPFTEFRPVHRIDKDTSGVILFSKNLEAHTFYTKQFKKREVRKTYLAVVDAKVIEEFNEKKDNLIIESNISKFPIGQTYQTTDERESEYAKTEIAFSKIIGEDKKFALLEVTPHTGRTHQIRVHLAELGFPIIGDEIYSGVKYSRLMLHAYRLGINLFSSGENIERKIFEAEVPGEFRNCK